MSPAKLSEFGARGVGLLIVAAVLVTMCNACGASALDRSTTALGTIRAAQAGAVATVRAGLEADLDRACGPLDGPAREACARERGEEYRTVESTLAVSAAKIDALALALLTWADRVVADEADEDAPPLPVCEALAALAGVAEAWSEVAGATLPVPVWTCGGES